MCGKGDVETMTDDESKFWVKISLTILKVVPSVAIDIKLSEEEKLAQKEHRINDLRWLRLGKSIKKDVDSALDEWILNL